MSGKKVKVTMEDVVQYLEGITILELADLVKTIEERFGVSAMPVTGPMQPVQQQVEEEKEPSGWCITLEGFEDGKKIPVIKAVRAEVAGLGLKDAKAFVEAAPSVIQESCLSETEAKRIKTAIEKDGGTVSIKPVW